MYNESTSKIYKLYEILNDFNRIRILVSLYKKEKTLKEIKKEIKLSETVVLEQLNYLINSKIIKYQSNEKIFKIVDKKIIKIIKAMLDYQ